MDCSHFRLDALCYHYEQLGGKVMTKVFVDGNSKEVCCVTEEGKWSRAKIDGKNTYNIAEYRAILYGLFIHPEATEVVSDSQLVIRQLNGVYAVKSGGLLPYWLRVKTRVEKLGHGVEFAWVKRDENKARRILG